MSKAKTATIKLDYPVQLPDRLLADVTMRRPTVGDLVTYPITDSTDLQGEFSLLCHLCSLSPEDATQLDAADYDTLRNQYIFFRSGTQPKKADAASPASGASSALPA